MSHPEVEHKHSSKTKSTARWEGIAEKGTEKNKTESEREEMWTCGWFIGMEKATEPFLIRPA